MPRRLLLQIGILLFPSLILGQNGYNSITVSSSAVSSAQPDQAAFVVNVTATADKSLDQILAALPGTGMTAANLTALSGPSPSIPAQTVPTATTLTWSFQLLVSTGKVKDTAATLAGLQKTLAQDNSGIALTFYEAGTQFSTPPCALSDLVADARARAQTIAAATGLSVGMTLGLTGASSMGAPVCLLTAKFAVGPQFAQTVPNTITITASRSLTPHPDQVQIAVILYSGLDVTQDQAVSAVSQAGISGATFAGLSSSSFALTFPTQTVLQWGFSVTVPLSKVSDTISQLNTATQSIPKSNSGLSLTYNVVGLQLSPDGLKAQACVQSDLITDAKSAAAQVAAAAGVHAGSILSVTAGGIGGAVPVAVAGNFASGYNFAGPGFASFLLGGPTVAPTTCSTAVQFQLLP